MRNTKVIQGWHCTRCGHKIPDAQCSTLRVLYTGTCSKCANEYSGTIQFRLNTGHNQTRLDLIENEGWTRAILATN